MTDPKRPKKGADPLLTEPGDMPAAPSGRLKRLAFPLFIAALVLFALALVVQSSTSGGAFEMTLAELRSGGIDQYIGKDVRVTGTVQAGSFRKMAGEKLAFRFTISDAEGNQIDVLWDQLLPDAFEEGREVIVQGKLTSAKEIHCARLTVKCPSKYKDENAVGGKKAEDYYKKKKVTTPPAEGAGDTH